MKDDLLTVIAEIRKLDCGAWMKDCTSGLFRCSDGALKRMELGRLLSKLYKTAASYEQKIVGIEISATLAERERCAVVAWNHYMNTCKNKGIAPSNFGDWLCAGAIRREP